jgi:hypothetical protein
MAAIEDIVAWCRAEQSRLAHQLEELQSGRLRTYEKHAQELGWLEIDTTVAIDRSVSAIHQRAQRDHRALSARSCPGCRPGASGRSSAASSSR